MTVDLIKELKGKKIVFGSKEAIRQISKGNVEAVYIAEDCRFADAILNAAKEIGVEKLDMSSQQMQTICKKPFTVSVISVLKENTGEEKKEKPEKKEKKVKKAKKTKVKKSKKKSEEKTDEKEK